jgi:serine/threonine-protein kinase RsbW
VTAIQEEDPTPKVMRWNWNRHARCVSLARSQMRKYLRYWKAEELTDSGTLLLSELLTNAGAPRGALLYPRSNREELEECSWV